MTGNKRRLALYRNGSSGSVSIPGSKSITNRALLLASFADGPSTLRGGLESEDSLLMRAALRKLGIRIDESNDGVWEVAGSGGIFTAGDHDLYLGNAGTAMRFLTAASALARGNIRLYGKPRMHERPLRDLIAALSEVGVEIDSENGNGCPPVIIAGTGRIRGGNCTISGRTSSQFLSAILQIAPLTDRGIHLAIEPPLVSKPYLEMTLSLLARFGIKTDRVSELEYVIEPQRYENIDLTIEADASSAAHVFSLAIAAGGEATITNFPQKSIQGDARFLEVAARFGAVAAANQNGMTLRMAREIQPLGEYDFEDMPDVSLAAATIAALAKGKSRLTGLSTLRKKECDRIEALRMNLERMGVRVRAESDALEIEGNPDALRGAEIETFDDHRVAMSFAALGTRVPGVVITNPDCVGKTFPGFWDVYETLRIA